MMDESRIFLDTAYAIALASRTDEHHQRAAALAAEMEREATRLVTTRAILLEIGNALAKIQYRQAAVGLLDALEQDEHIEIIPLTDSLYERALGLYRQRSDKDWGMTDCISFVVMGEKGLQIALTTDEHFQQAGFRALLREHV